jgi:hypothetical protein
VTNLECLALADLEAGGPDDVVIGVEPLLQGVKGLRVGEVGDQEVYAVVVGGRQPGPAVPLPDAVGQRNDSAVEHLHVHGAAGDEHLQYTERSRVADEMDDTMTLTVRVSSGPDGNFNPSCQRKSTCLGDGTKSSV